MAKEFTVPKGVFDSRKIYGYAQAVKAGDTIYLAGQVAHDEQLNVISKGDFAAQAVRCYENTRRTLEAAGGKMEDIVWMTLLNKDVRHWPKQSAAGKKYFGRHCPAATCIEIPALFQPGLLLEVQSIAFLGKKEFINPPNVAETRKKYGYSQAIRAGNTIYLAGMVAWDEQGNVIGKGDFAAQAAQCYENIKRTLEAAGGKMEDIVWMTLLNKDVRHWPEQSAAGKKYFGRHFPAATCIQVAGLFDPDLLLEVQAIAVIGEDKELINPPNVAETRKKYGYSQAVRAGNTIYLAGMVAWDEQGNVVGKGDFAAQAAQCYENIKRTLEAAGGKMEDIVWMTYLSKDLRYWPEESQAGEKYLGRHFSAGTCIQVADLFDPELLLEVQAIAVLDR